MLDELTREWNPLERLEKGRVHTPRNREEDGRVEEGADAAEPYTHLESVAHWLGGLPGVSEVRRHTEVEGEADGLGVEGGEASDEDDSVDGGADVVRRPLAEPGEGRDDYDEKASDD